MSVFHVISGILSTARGKVDRLRVQFPRPMARLLGEYPQYPLEDREALAGWNHANIPGVFYQTSESRHLGRTHYLQINAFRRLNPELSFKFFDCGQRDDYMRNCWSRHPIAEIYECARFGQVKADIFRYCILWERGGMYCDIKSRFTVPLASLLNEQSRLVLAYENRFVNVAPPVNTLTHLHHPQRLALQWALIAAPKHPLLHMVLEDIVDAAPSFNNIVYEDPQSAICRFTGPGRYTQALWAWVAQSGTIEALQQVGIDFDNKAEYSMPGAWSRWALNPHYSLVRNAPILSGLSLP